MTTPPTPDGSSLGEARESSEMRALRYLEEWDVMGTTADGPFMRTQLAIIRAALASGYPLLMRQYDEMVDEVERLRSTAAAAHVTTNGDSGEVERERDLWRAEWQQITDTAAAMKVELDQLRSQVQEFRRECDPKEERVLVTAAERAQIFLSDIPAPPPPEPIPPAVDDPIPEAVRRFQNGGVL